MDNIKEIITADRYLVDSNSELFEKMAMFHNYTTHNQWPEAAKQKLIDEDRPVLEIDITKPKLDTYSGIERNFRTGWSAAPTESNDREQATLITALLKWHNRNRRIDKVVSRVFKDGGTDGVGWYGCRARMGDDFMGELVVERVSGFQIRFDRQTLELDLADTPLLERDRWMTNEQLIGYWPKAEGQLATPTETMDPSDLRAAFSSETDDYPEEVADSWRYYIDAKFRKRRVVELYQRVHELKELLINPETGEVFDLQTFFDSPLGRAMWRLASIRRGSQVQVKSLEDIIEMAKSVGYRGLTIGKKPSSEIHVVTFTGGLVLEESRKIIYKHNQYPYIPSFGFVSEREDGQMYYMGIVEALLGLQDEKNKGRSSFQDILGRAPKGGGWFDESKGVGKEDIVKIHKPGVWVGLKGKPSELIEERTLNYIPLLQHFMERERMAEDDANRQGVSLPLQGVASNSRESGFAARTRIQQSMSGIAEPLEHSGDGKLTLALQLISNMQQFFPRAKIERIINKADLNVSDQAIQKFLTDFKITNYDVSIDQSKDSSTMRAWMRQELIEIMQFAGDQAAALVPALIKLGDYPDPDEILKMLGMPGNTTGNNQPGNLTPGPQDPLVGMG